MTNREAYETVKRKLADAGIEDAAFEARQLFYAASGMNAAGMLSHYSEEAGIACITRLIHDCTERIAGTPLQYLLGKWSFHSVEVIVREGVLIPRADSEVLADCGINYLKNREPAAVIDLCSGTGCIALALEKNAPAGQTIIALEKHKIPLQILRENIALNHSAVQAAAGDVLTGEGPKGPFGLILCNPPYIRSAELDSLQREVKQEPREALDGGADGLDFYRALCRHWAPRLQPGGMLAAEIGFDQAEEVSALFAGAGLNNIKILQDTAGLDRVVCAYRATEKNDKDGENHG